MRLRKRVMDIVRLLSLLVLINFGWAGNAKAQADSLKDTSSVRKDSVVAMPEVNGIKEAPEDERMAVLAAGLVVLGGFVVLLVLRRREVDRSAGLR